MKSHWQQNFAGWCLEPQSNHSRLVMNLYFNTNVETDWPIPDVNLILSLGSVLFVECCDLRESFSANLQTRECGRCKRSDDP